MENKLYLIHREDYISHISDKVSMYLALKQLTDLVWDLPLTEETRKLREATEHIDFTADICFNSWGISPSFVAFRSGSDLAELMLHELIAPEDAGYYACDDTCCCPCGCCCDNCDLDDDDEDFDDEDYDDEDEIDDYDEDETDVDDDFAELMAGLSSIAQNIFGDNVSVHIVVE